MKYYAACTTKEEVDNSTFMPPYCLLTSFHYFKDKIALVKECVKSKFDVFVDSGAFSAANSGKAIDINEYCRFIIETGVTTYAALDVIGSHAKTMENVKFMEREYGLTPIPTFHIGGDPKNLEEIYNEYAYIALGGLVFASGVVRYCDEIWGIILRNKPKLRVHGFGVTNFDLVERYPWYSVDSSSFKSGQMFGRQTTLWNGLDFKTWEEDDYFAFMKKMGFPTDTMTKKEKRLLTTNHSCQSYRIYCAHLSEVNKHKDFSYLTNQQKLF